MIEEHGYGYSAYCDNCRRMFDVDRKAYQDEEELNMSLKFWEWERFKNVDICPDCVDGRNGWNLEINISHKKNI